MSENNKVALITGAGAGIGRAVSIAFLRAGYSLVLAGRRIPPLQQTVAMAEVASAQSLCISCDVGDPEQVQSLFLDIQNRYERLDVLFNNAGFFSPVTAIEDISFADWQAALNTNLSGAFLCAQQAVKLMKMQQPQGGRIINNGSISAHAPRPDSVAYTTTKHAISGLTKCIALDGRKHNIACGQIDIGNATTEMTEKMVDGVRQANGELAVEPLMDVEHIASAVLQMADLPLESNILSMTIMATKMPFVGRG